MKWGLFGSATGQFDQPRGVGFDSVGDVYVADGENNRIQKFSFLVPVEPITWGKLKTTYRADD